MKNWTIHAALYSGKGSIRKNNEDAFYFNGSLKSFSQMDEEVISCTDVMNTASLWAVCDGMGGHQNGEVASYTAVSGMQGLQDHLTGRDFETTVQSWVRQANKAVLEHAEGGGTTMVMLYCTDTYVQIAHVGDSRVYRMHDGELTQITSDHSKVEMLVAAGMITREEAEKHPQKHMITRFVGMNDEYVCQADVSRKIPLVNGDRYLLCSDGVTDMISDDIITAELSDSQDVETCVQHLRDAVYDAGARDNLTMIILEVETESMDQSQESHGEVPLPDMNDENEPTVDESDTERTQINVEVDLPETSISNCEITLNGKNGRVRLSVGADELSQGRETSEDVSFSVEPTD